ncbi:hypothetical protein [Streptomyces canus]|uniref:hypothetical protein n=1 Tax=Streptomyces canus TaxID=58343 RepID=UPI0036E79A94
MAVIAAVLGPYAAGWRLTRKQLMAVATVLSALNPAIPVLLALVLLEEHLNRRQAAGPACTGRRVR